MTSSQYSSYEIVLLGTRSYQAQSLHNQSHSESAKKPQPLIKSLITNKIELLPITIGLEGVDGLIFTSAYGINALLESSRPNSPFYNPLLTHWHKIPSFVISPKSAKLLEKEGAEIAYIGNGRSGSEFAKQIAPLLKGKTPLYFRAKSIVSRLDEILLSSHIPLREQIAYINHPLPLSQAQKPKPKSILIFTSPSAFYSFTQSYEWEADYLALAIGESTLKAFPTHIRSIISPTPSIEGCIQYAKSLL